MKPARKMVETAHAAFVFGVAGLVALTHGDVITVKNGGAAAVTFSDLIVRNNAGQEEVLKQPGFGAAATADDEALAAGVSRVFHTTIKNITKVFVSCKTGAGAAASEQEWKADVTIWPAPDKKSSFYFRDSQSNLALHAAVVSPAGGTLSLPLGMVATVINGHAPELPGLFIGTGFNLQTFEITGPFTGEAQVVAGPLDVKFSCDGDCNESGSLTVADFACFQTAFVLGDPYADCNGSGSLTIADFTCFQNNFLAGCPPP